MTNLRLSLCSVLIVGTLSLGAQPMSYDAMRDNARYLTDRMAYTLGLGDPLLDDLYCINYDYICGVNDYLDDVAVGYRYDDYNLVLAARDAALMALLTPAQWTALIAIDYFYRPIVFASRHWYFGIYHHLPFTGHWYFRQPAHYPSYRGGRFFAGMNPGGGHAPGYQMRRQQQSIGNGYRGGNNTGNGYRIGGSSRGESNGNVGSNYSGRSSSTDNARSTGTSGRSSGSSSTKSSTSVKSNARSVGTSTTTGSRSSKLSTSNGSLSKSKSSSSSRSSAGKASSRTSSSKSSSSGRSASRGSSGRSSGGGSKGSR